MKVTGHELGGAIILQSLRRDTAARAYEGSLRAFPDEKKETPQEIVGAFLQAEENIARLQVAQMRYNLAQVVTVKGIGEITLASAIKLVGGAGRIEKMWRSATGPKPDRYGSRYDDERDPNKIVSKPTITVSEAVRLASLAAKRAGAIRAAIATANLREMEIEDLEPSFFE